MVPDCEWVSQGFRRRKKGRRWVPGEIIKDWTCKFSPQPGISDEPFTPEAMVKGNRRLPRVSVPRVGPGGFPFPGDIDLGVECPYREVNTGYWVDTYEVVEDEYNDCVDEEKCTRWTE